MFTKIIGIVNNTLEIQTDRNRNVICSAIITLTIALTLIWGIIS